MIPETFSLLRCLQTVPLFIKQTFFDRFDFCGIYSAFISKSTQYAWGNGRTYAVRDASSGTCTKQSYLL